MHTDFILSLAAAMSDITPGAPGRSGSAGPDRTSGTAGLPGGPVKAGTALDWSLFSDPLALMRSVTERLPGLTVDGRDYVVIDAVAQQGHSGADLLATLSAQYDLIHGAHYGSVASGLLPVDRLADLEDLASLEFASAAASTSFAGSVTTQDDIALQADVARSTFDVDGTGVSVGIISDSFDASLTATTRYADDIASGDLPANVTVLEDLSEGNSIDEGRAMAQLVHDIAPGADLLFATGFTGAAGFAANIDALVAAGADIIVDDLIYLFEPMFQDGIIAQAAADAVDAGVSYFSSAGNNGSAGYAGPFRGTVDGTLEAIVPFGAGTRFHDWDPGAGVDTTLDITIPAGSSADLILQWADPFSSTFGSLGPDGTSPGAATDLDFHLLDSSGAVLFSSLTVNGGFNPTERLAVDNFSSQPLDAQIVINNFEGPDPDLMRIVGFSVPNSDFVTGYDLDTSASFSDLSEFRAPTTYGHAVADGVLGVGAVPFFYSEPFGAVDGAVPETFSALGGSVILFDADGNRLAEPEIRDAIDFAATNGGNTTFFGNDIALQPSLFPGGNPDPDSFPNFFGTSAAAPNAAAVAALMLEANPALTPADIERILEETAVDITAPFSLTNPSASFTAAFQDLASVGVAPGTDARTGAGLIDAAAAVAQAGAEGAAGDAPGDGTAGTAGDDTLVGTPGPDTLSGLDGDDVIDGTGGRDVLSGGPGADSLSGGDGVDSLDGGDGADTLDGGRDDDTIQGGAGDDIIRVTAGIGEDRVDGGAGTDRIEATRDRLTIGLRTVTDVETITAAGFEDVRIAGTSAGDDLDVSTVTLNGIASIGGLGGSDTLVGSAGGDDLRGGAGADSLDGFTGADTLTGGGGTDTIRGGEGRDLILFEGSSNGVDDVDGGAGLDTILATADGTVIGLRALNSVETISGNDHVDVVIRGSQGADDLDLSEVAVLDVSFTDTEGGRDRLTGSAGDDDLRGGAGADTLDGGAGGDSLTGGTGADIFIVEDGTGTDEIVDFERGRDRLDLGGVSHVTVFGDLDSSGDGVVDSADASAALVNGRLVLSFSDAVIGLTGVTELSADDLLL